MAKVSAQMINHVQDVISVLTLKYGYIKFPRFLLFLCVCRLQRFTAITTTLETLPIRDKSGESPSTG